MPLRRYAYAIFAAAFKFFEMSFSLPIAAATTCCCHADKRDCYAIAMVARLPALAFHDTARLIV